MIKKHEILICGAGIIGLALARELLKRGYRDIAVLEKESEAGKHASGRNSGVLHAGIYYAPDTLRARFCINGNRMMREYCADRGLQAGNYGKVIVVKNREEIPVLEELHRRALANGAETRLIDEQELARLEPNALTHGPALHSPNTTVVDPGAIIRSLVADCAATGKVTFYYNTEVKSFPGLNIVASGTGTFEYGLFINAAGSFSDRIAHTLGIAQQYRLLPFKGIYKKLKKEKSHMYRGSIYPVPNIHNPFLGVHFTRNVHGDVYLGPTAIPAFGRENYGLLKGMDREALDIFYRDAILFWVNPEFRSVALEEPKKYLFKYFFNDAAQLVKELDPADIEESDKVGIRPQLVDWSKKKLVTDFVVIKEDNTVHILNSISPAFTCSFPFAEFVVDKYVS